MARDRHLTEEERKLWRDTMHGKPPAMPEKSVKKESAVPVGKPKKSTAPAPPLKPASKGEATRLFNAKKKPEAKIDLHDMTQAEAHEALLAFILRAHKNGKRRVAIVTGKGAKGEGVLKRNVPRWLETPALRPFISAIAPAPREKGGEGVLYVLLKKS